MEASPAAPVGDITDAVKQMGLGVARAVEGRCGAFEQTRFSVAERRVKVQFANVTLLQERDRARRQRRLRAQKEVRSRLRAALGALVPGQRVIVFGSLIKPGQFHDRSDVDLALEVEPPGMDLWRLAAELMDHLGRPVDILLLNRCRFREKILKEGEVWTV